MTTDSQQVAAWKALLVSAKKWGRPVRYQELEAAVAMIERHPYGLPDASERVAKAPDTSSAPATANYREVQSTRNPGPPFSGISQAEIEAPAIYEANQRTAAVLDTLSNVPERQNGPAPFPFPPTDPQIPPTVAPRTDGKREDRARAFNEAAKAWRAQGLTTQEIGAKWRELKAKDGAP